jgi:protein O-mannosyl-transferase
VSIAEARVMSAGAPWGANVGLVGADGRLAGRAWVLVGMLALLVGLPSLGNGFAYDDVFIIVRDARVHDLSQWRSWWTDPYWTSPPDGKYRPLTTSLFALQWVLGAGSPATFHAANVLLHSLVSLAVLSLTLQVVAPLTALGVAMLFAVHPVHVEAVANVVGQSELIAGLCLVLGATVYVRARREGRLAPRHLVVLWLLYSLGVFAKEHALLLPALWFAAELTVLRGQRRLRDVVRGTWPAYLGTAILAALALGARWQVLGAMDIGNVHGSLRGLDLGARSMVMLSIVPEIVRLMVWPMALHADYSPLHVVVSPEPMWSQVPGVVAVLGFLALMAWAWRRQAALAFAGAFFLLPWLPTANLLFPSGVLLAERALYTPSAGFLLGVGVVVERWWQAQPRAPGAPRWVVGLLLVAVSLGLWRSATRAPLWASSDRLFESMVAEQPLSAKAHVLWGSVLEERGDLDGALREWRMAVRIDSASSYNQSAVGQLLARGGRCDAAIPFLREAIRLGGVMLVTRETLVRCLAAAGDVVGARAALTELAGRGGKASVVRELQSELDDREQGAADDPSSADAGGVSGIGGPPRGGR